MFDESAGRRRIRVEGSRKDVLQDLLAILEEVYQSKTLKKEELFACVEAATMGKEQMVKEILNRMPLVMMATAMGDKDAQKLADGFLNLFKQDKDE